MLKPDEIKNITFEQSVFSGYKKEDVDEFLDKVFDSFSALYKENAELVQKLKVCVKKIEEYRQDEKFLKAAIINAQKLNETAMKDITASKEQAEKEASEKAAAIVAEAEQKAADIMSSAESRVAEFREKTTKEFAEQKQQAAQAFSLKKKEYQDEQSRENAELTRLKNEVADFRNRILVLYKEQVASIMSLPDEKVEVAPVEPTAPEEVTTDVKEETVVEPVAEPTVAPVADPVVTVEKEQATESKEEIVPEDVEASEFTETASEETEVKAEEAKTETVHSPVEPEPPVINEADGEEDENDDELRNDSPLSFGADLLDDDVIDEEIHPVQVDKEKRFKNLKFGIGFDVNSDK